MNTELKPTKSEYDFDHVYDRSGTNAIKNDPRILKLFFGYEDLLPLWVADMDFRAPEVIVNALEQRIRHPIYGYTTIGKKYVDAIKNWFERRHNWKIDTEWIRYSPGVVPAINFIIQQYSRPGDRVIIQPPVYYPFKQSIEENGRCLLQNELIYKNNQYSINFEDLEELCKQKRVKMLILCNPHNPVGRVWTFDELEQIGKICIKYDVMVVSDEIHCDLIMPGHKYTPFASISEEFAQNSIICTAPTKTFNLAGLQVSNVIIPNEKLRTLYSVKQNLLGLHGPTIFGAEALKAAYNLGEDWLNAVLKYIYNNYLYFVKALGKNMPKAKVLPLEGTYLLWVDFRAYQIEDKEMNKKIREDAKIALDGGTMFGLGGKGFQRFNLACPRSILEEVIQRLTPIFAQK